MVKKPKTSTCILLNIKDCTRPYFHLGTTKLSAECTISDLIARKTVALNTKGMATGALCPRIPSTFSALLKRSSLSIAVPVCVCEQQRQRRTFITLPGTNKKKVYSGRQLVGYTMDQMFSVVSDVENYYKFVPWCKKSIVLMKQPNLMKADLMVGFPPINESYTSSITLVKPHLVKAECTEGKLFNHLLTQWRFSPGLKRERRSCVVDFHITFEFRSAFHSQLSHLFFDQVARQMEGAFIKEVGRRYGKATLQPRNLLITSQS